MACKDFGDATLDSKFAERDAHLVYRLQNSLAMSKGDKRQARRLMKEAGGAAA